MAQQAMYDYVERLSELFKVAVRQAGAEFGLLPIHLQVLNYLASSNRFSDTPSAVAEYLGQTKGPVSQTLKVLQEKGLVEKVPDERDGRVTHLAVTKQGVKILDRVLKNRDLNEASARLGPERSAEIEQAISDLISALLQASDSKSFGICGSCRFNQKVGDKAFFCNLVEEPLTLAETKLRCREHQPT